MEYKPTKYWTDEQEQAVDKYQNFGAGTTQANQIFEEQIFFPMKIMVEHIIRKYNLCCAGDNHGDLVQDTLCHMLFKLEGYDESRGSRAYSYFYRVAKNFLLNIQTKNKRDNYRFICIDDVRGL